jgi:hypothetical protein
MKMKKISFGMVLVAIIVVLPGCYSMALGKSKPVERRFMDKSLWRRSPSTGKNHGAV